MSVSDGNNSGEFKVINAGSSVIGYQWSWSAPSGAGNSPTVSFSSPTLSPTSSATRINNAKWFAYPNVTCAPLTSTYTIQCTVTISGGRSKTAKAYLSVKIPETGGTTESPTVSGGMYDNQSGDPQKPWRLDPNSVYRTEPPVTINVHSNSQFYNKASVHEAEHVKQWKTGFMKGYFTVNSFLNYVTNSGVKVKDLKAATVASIKTLVERAYRNWYLDEYNPASQHHDKMERGAYNVSDSISPQYRYQGQCYGY